MTVRTSEACHSLDDATSRIQGLIIKITRKSWSEDTDNVIKYDRNVLLDSCNIKQNLSLHFMPSYLKNCAMLKRENKGKENTRHLFSSHYPRETTAKTSAIILPIAI